MMNKTAREALEAAIESERGRMEYWQEILGKANESASKALAEITERQAYIDELEEALSEEKVLA